jgi:hypothetical protein
MFTLENRYLPAPGGSRNISLCYLGGKYETGINKKKEV